MGTPADWDENMPHNHRDLGRAVRELMQHRPGQTYTATRAQLEEWMDGREETPLEAVAVLADPANEILCETCGWTVGMICPECSKGCGCEISCSGWRHQDWGPELDPEEEDERNTCEECGGDFRMMGYDIGCICGWPRPRSLGARRPRVGGVPESSWRAPTRPARLAAVRPAYG
ncbi:hypothetical protein GCM10022226_61390 [Sphaerisporangium flaviroseum]|uniref:4Fe-4S ferredoxin-type domain-containing protein n=1 Tax=Sphaerisporangium flaviroseum TaxID=509199 RepID=A0ABP7J112_9ACTN